jgi:hydroxyacyl-ACP dehydratase HTD2-like protein with hotdog domain
MNNFKDWIGKKISRSDIITPRLVDHLNKTIDLNCLSDQTVPEGIFLCYAQM